MHETREKHLFSFYITDLTSLIKNEQKEMIIKDSVLIHRMKDIIRMKERSECYFFDQQVHVFAHITLINKKEIHCFISKKALNDYLKPHITLLLPLLKRNALEEAVYNATEAGASLIQLITTKKSEQNLPSNELARLQKIIIAAAEQSKNFHFPTLMSPISYEKIAPSSQGTKIWFDKNGVPFFNVISSLKEKKPDLLTIIIGPEGDFTAQEQATIVQAGFESYALTPTTLRSISAVTLAVGSIRSMVNSQSHTL